MISDIAYSCTKQPSGAYSIDWLTGGAERLTGYSVDDLKSLGCWRSLVVDEDLPVFDNYVIGLAPGTKGSCELRLRHKTGGILRIASFAECFVDAESPDSLRLYGGWVDITERTLAEEALRESEQRLSQIINFLPDATIAVDSEGRVIAWNRAMEDMTGVPAGEMIGKGNHEYALPFYGTRRPILLDLVLTPNKEMRQTYSLFKADKDVLTVEAENATPLGKNVILWAKAAPLLDVHGMIVGAIETIRDVTDRKLAEKKIQRQSTLVVAINLVLREALESETDADIARTCLRMAEEITGSSFGFIGEVNEAGRLDTIAVSDPGWKVCRIPESNSPSLIKHMEIRGIWGSVLKGEQSLIINDPASHPDSVGVPDGHPSLTSFMGVPLKRSGKTFGLIALANKEGGYDPSDVADVEALSSAFVPVPG